MASHSEKKKKNRRGSKAKSGSNGIGMSKRMSGDGDVNGYQFKKMVLKNDPYYSIDFDHLLKHPKFGYIIVELLLCEERGDVNPWTSHPNRYMDKNWKKFVALYRASRKMEGNLCLVNFAKPGTKYEDRVRFMQVKNVSRNGGVDLMRDKKMSFEEFSNFYRMLNGECAGIL